jgi:two-component system, NtrC family, response regulator AtoC
MSADEHETELLGVRAAPPKGLRIVGMWSGGHVVLDVPPSGTLVVGRGEGADLALDVSSISRRHATILLEPPPRIRDEASANGTWVDGQRLAPGEVAALRPGSVVELGAATLVFVATPDLDGGEPRSESVVVDAAMRRVHELVDVVAKSKLTVLLLGETGVGKEMLAARVHAHSSRADKPFSKLNCAALVESLLESELFGHERGAFTGATQTKAGLVEATDGGTLFLDEVGELTLATQAKLLRVLENGEVVRVGATKATPVDVRWVCATNRNLREMVAAGRFREDLYFRLDGMTIQVPPLRERRADIAPLARRFLEEAARAAGRPVPELGEDAIEALVAHPWRGNVRELRNVVTRSQLFCQETTLRARHLLLSEDAPPSIPPAPASGGDRRARVLDALEKTGWNRTQAAKLLGVSRRTLHTWLLDLGIPSARSRAE